MQSQRMKDEGSESEVDGEGDEESGQSDDDDSIKSMADLKKLVPCTLEEFAKRVVGIQESSSAAESSGTAESSEEEKRSLQKGDRVKYVGASVVVEADNRIILGKVPTQDGSKNAYTFISGRTLSNGQRGEVYEINGDQVAVIFDPPEEKVADGNKDEVDKVQNAKPAVYWVDNSSQWLSRAVPRSNHREFVEKVEEMFDQLTGPLVLICGQNIAEASTAAPKDKEPRTLLFHNLARLSPLFYRCIRLHSQPSSLKRLVGDLKGRKPSRSSDITKLFKNRLFIPLPKDDEQLSFQ